MTHLILAYYKFTPIKDPHEEVARHKAFFSTRDISSRIYISEQGINGQMSGTVQAAREYMDWMHARPEFETVEFKLHKHHEHVYPRVTVKYRAQLVALDAPANVSQAGEHLSPQRWKQMLEKENERLVLDIRNDYEWKIGHFEGAECPPCETFRDFNKYAENLKDTVDKKNTSVMMYCTGGIRCELFSAVLKEHGFEKVYQLSGGVIKYGQEEGNTHWLGKLFVFDDRLAVPLSEQEGGCVISYCHHCKKPNDTYHNCANMDCNELFLCCSECLERFQGCCQEVCQHSNRVRPYNPLSNKPFRKWSQYASNSR